ncbi:energy-coupling factor transporter transmembrane protein EcfT [Corynebacterium aquatimens]|uniref:energy-coupling factor transporter transmembrane component T family protein n=1 Tax=Corynebacterium TaxID=1716 RepID=UPI001F16D795|nr:MULTISPECIES: energy-coupling factor transporter transmembrane component T [Corynebacterium]QYH19599.1 energy-coupling factor transporter transmembrane protein EcfT [Corynebacterium aquatimens]UIZ91424.1 energy-coupling factor transporter transmembrane protein EcfT [Corynebacterium sp. CNCTC7651]
MIRELPLGVYVPGDTVLHRAGPTLKFVLLVVFILWVTIWPSLPWQSMAALTFVMFLYAVAKIPPRVAWNQLVPLLPILVFLGAFMLWQNGIAGALTTLIGLLATIAAANLLTLTTTVEELLDALDKNLAPLAKVGVPVELINLTIALTIRLIPLMLATANEVLEARKARGAGFSITAFGIPLVIRSVRRAKLIGEALMARGAVD